MIKPVPAKHLLYNRMARFTIHNQSRWRGPIAGDAARQDSEALCTVQATARLAVDGGGYGLVAEAIDADSDRDGMAEHSQAAPRPSHA